VRSITVNEMHLVNMQLEGKEGRGNRVRKQVRENRPDWSAQFHARNVERISLHAIEEQFWLVCRQAGDYHSVNNERQPVGLQGFPILLTISILGAGYCTN
jgi:hypothetical protein